MSYYDEQTRRTVLDGRRVLERTGESLARSNQIAIETEQTGTQVTAELGEQRETLLRTKARLTNIHSGLDETRNTLKRMSRNVVYNKIIIYGIILLEVIIILAMVYMKIVKRLLG